MKFIQAPINGMIINLDHVSMIGPLREGETGYQHFYLRFLGQDDIFTVGNKEGFNSLNLDQEEFNVFYNLIVRYALARS